MNESTHPSKSMPEHVASFYESLLGKPRSRRLFFGGYVHSWGEDRYDQATYRYLIGTETVEDRFLLAELADEELPCVTFWIRCTRIVLALRRLKDEMVDSIVLFFQRTR